MAGSSQQGKALRASVACRRRAEKQVQDGLMSVLRPGWTSSGLLEASGQIYAVIDQLLSVQVVDVTLMSADSASTCEASA